MWVVFDGKLLVISFVDQELFITNPDPHLDPVPDPYQYHVITEGHHGQLEWEHPILLFIEAEQCCGSGMFIPEKQQQKREVKKNEMLNLFMLPPNLTKL